jgi:hypothetical protein
MSRCPRGGAASGYHAAFSGPYTVALATLARCVEDPTALLTSAGER